MDWEGARARDKARKDAHRQRQPRTDRAVVLAAYVAKHRLSCFKCGTNSGPWAKTGVSNRGPWVICLGCVQGPSE